MSEERSPTERRLHVGASTTPGEVFLPRAAVEFSELRPDVELDVRIADTEEIVTALKGREVELAVVGREVDDPDLQGRVLEQDELVLVVAASSAALLVAEPSSRITNAIPARSSGCSSEPAISEEALGAAGQEASVAMELGSNAAVVAAVAEGEGLVGVVPARQLGDDRRVGRLRVRGLSLRRPFVLLTERGRKTSGKAVATLSADQPHPSTKPMKTIVAGLSIGSPTR
jgi:LysR family transcriptional regulator, low CO2-responsive transcriptional regulator